MTQALLRFRQGGFLKLTDDYEEEVIGRRYRRRVYY
jgi:hypothetical protein